MPIGVDSPIRITPGRQKEAGHAVEEVKRVQVDGAQRHGGGAPLRLAGGGGARPQEGEGASEGEAPARPDAAGWTLRTGAPAGRGA